MSDQLFHPQFPPARRMTEENPNAPPVTAEIELIPANYFAPLDLAQVFHAWRRSRSISDAATAAFLAALAERFPERNFLGLEKLAGRVRRACKKASRLALPNVRVLRIESGYAIQYLLPPASVDVVHLLFPDPWPKKKHKRRRIVQAPISLSLVHRLLVPDGRFRIATDQEDYFAADPRSDFARGVYGDDARDEIFPLTTFERHFLAEGAPIYRLELRKVS